MTQRKLLQVMAASLSIAAAALQMSPAVASDSNKWRIECNHNAHSDGEIVFRIVPKGGAPTDVTVQIANGTSENNVARAIRDAFRAQLPEEAYHIETDDGEDVLVKKKHGAANFELTLVSSTVDHVKFDIEKE